MTRRLVLVNMSDNDAEDFDVLFKGRKRKLAPGDHVDVTEQGDISVEMVVEATTGEGDPNNYTYRTMTIGRAV